MSNDTTKEFDPYSAEYTCPKCDGNTCVNVSATCVVVLRLNDHGSVTDSGTYWETCSLDGEGECNACGYKAPLRDFVIRYVGEEIPVCPDCERRMRISTDGTVVACIEGCYTEIPYDLWNLKPGDTVFWRDPDEGTCSKWVKIACITFAPGHDEGDPMVILEGEGDGEYLECLLKELTRKPTLDEMVECCGDEQLRSTE